jgi:hypothetical protein
LVTRGLMLTDRRPSTLEFSNDADALMRLE